MSLPLSSLQNINGALRMLIRQQEHQSMRTQRLTNERQHQAVIHTKYAHKAFGGQIKSSIETYYEMIWCLNLCFAWLFKQRWEKRGGVLVIRSLKQNYRHHGTRETWHLLKEILSWSESLQADWVFYLFLRKEEDIDIAWLLQMTVYKYALISLNRVPIIVYQFGHYQKILWLFLQNTRLKSPLSIAIVR